MARYTRGYYGPRFGVPGYTSAFTRYTPYAYRSGFVGRSYFPYHHRHHRHTSFGFSFDFGFYRNYCSYPTYPLTYYPSYYAPLYPAYASTFFPAYPTYYASSVLVTTPTYTYVPQPVVEYVPTYSGPQYAVADAYTEGTVEAPVVTYEDEYAQAYPQEVAPSDTYVQQAPQEYPSEPVQPQYPQYQQQAPTDSYPQQHADAGTARPDVYSEHQLDAYREMPQTPSPAVPEVPVTPQAPSSEPPPPSEPAPAPQEMPAQEAMPADAEPTISDSEGGQAAIAEPAPAEETLEDEEWPELKPEQIAELQQLMVSGTQGFGEGRYAEAAAYFRQVVEVDPHNIDAVLAHGVARFATGDYDLSADSIRLGVSLFPPIVDSLFDIRERYQKTADFVDQTGRLEAHLERQPEDGNALLVLGFVRHFSGQRDLAEQTFQRLKRVSPEDGELADVFLNALPPEAVAAALLPPDDDKDSSGTLDVKINRDPLGVPSTQPAGQAAVDAGSVDPGVLSVATQPANMQKIAIPSDPLFDGKLSMSDDAVPRAQATVDGIDVRLKSTDDRPPQASVEIIVDDRRMRVRRFIPGAHVVIKGVSGQTYKLVLTEVDNETESIRYMIAEEKNPD